MLSIKKSTFSVGLQSVVGVKSQFIKKVQSQFINRYKKAKYIYKTKLP